MPAQDTETGTYGMVSRILHGIVSQIPPSSERPAANPVERAHQILQGTAVRAAALSGTMALPPGPLGLATVIPDLIAIWRMQQQLTADIAAVFGKSSYLTRETMVICLFKHGDVLLTRGLFSHVGESVLIQRVAARTLQQLLAKVAVRVTQRLAAKGISRWLPVVGALGVGAHAYYDTSNVGANAIEVFSRDIQLEPEDKAAEEPAVEVSAWPPEEEKPAGKPRRPRKPRSAKKNGSSTNNGHEPLPENPSDF